MKDRFKFRFWYFNKVEEKWKLWNCDLMSVDGTCLPFDDVEGGAYTDLEHKFVCEQCTGLKDRNQKLIYEGDILDFDLSTPRNGGHYRGFIRWQKQNELIGWMISDMDMTGDWDLRQIAHPNDWMVYGEIIGNIHENRELLEFNPEDYDIEV